MRFATGLVVFCLAAAAAFGQITIVPTTTLAAETGNNTSAASTFTGTSNGNLPAGNVSQEPIRDLAYTGSTTKFLTAAMGWWGKSGHINIGYTSNDAAEVHKQILDMRSRGFDGLTLAWYGYSSTELSNQTALLMIAEAEKNPGFTFALRPNDALLKYYPHGTTATDTLIYHLTYAANTYFPSPAYQRIGGRPVLLMFNFTSDSIDWTRVRASVPGNPLFIFRNSGSFTLSYSDGAFAWGPSSGLTYLDSYYTKALSYPAKPNYGNAYKGFNDTIASWTQNRIVDQQCGQLWLQSIAEASKYYSSSKQLPLLMISTWNDYEEGTEIETGISNCLSIASAISGNTLSWSLSGTGKENTIAHYVVFISTDGQNLMPLAQVPAGVHSLDLGNYSLGLGAYYLFVKAVGKSSIANHMSNSVKYQVANQPPKVSLTLTPASGAAPLTVAVSVVASDPDGTLQSSTVNFGDGTTASGFTFSHTYMKAASYTLSAVVTDNGGASTTATAGINATGTACAASTASFNVVICSPGTSSADPVPITAVAYAPKSVKRMDLWIDGVKKYTVYSSKLATSLTLATGTRRVAVTATDGSGASTKTVIYTNVN